MINEKEYDQKVLQIESLFDLQIDRGLNVAEQFVLNILLDEVDEYDRTYHRPKRGRAEDDFSDLPLLNYSHFPLESIGRG